MKPKCFCASKKAASAARVYRFHIKGDRDSCGRAGGIRRFAIGFGEGGAQFCEKAALSFPLWMFGLFCAKGGVPVKMAAVRRGLAFFLRHRFAIRVRPRLRKHGDKFMRPKKAALDLAAQARRPNWPGCFFPGFSCGPALPTCAFFCTRQTQSPRCRVSPPIGRVRAPPHRLCIGRRPHLAR